MAVRLMQFIPLKSIIVEDHPVGEYDSLHEKDDTAIDGLVHRYPDKALFLPLNSCPVHCLYCTRAYGVGPDTELVTKDSFKLAKSRIAKVLAYIASHEELQDIVVSGGDAYYLPPHVLEWIGETLISIPNIRRFRFASKGLAVSPQRFLDPADEWTKALIRVSDKAKQAGKHMALHTHFNHPSEISWITEKASLKLLQAGVTVRNQTVLLRGINDNVPAMSTLIRKLADMVIQPTILDMEEELTGSIAGFCMPKFVVDLPGGGGKRLARSFKSYDRQSGLSTFTSPILTTGEKAGKVYEYYDPINTLEKKK
ncbi:putative l-lysine - protein [Eutypa lata UCREL1]|uniref:Putative l-lysine-protein n=1 Tax=Eutypa lata (strain UCR-EL1) TaxID=1287681 RepID=M7SGW2_EUTLA|nr:putative l-lysine - protein [Eutypa lata UCREL1]